MVQRRGVLLSGALMMGAALLTACGKKKIPLPEPLPDVAVLTAAITGEEHLVGLYTTALAARPGLSARLSPALGHHRDHLTVLRRFYVPSTNERTASPTPTPTPAATLPSGQGAVLAALRDAERRAMADRTAALSRVPAPLAQVFASIAACEAGHAAGLGWHGGGF